MTQHESNDNSFPPEWAEGAEVSIGPRVPFFGPVTEVGPNVIMADGSLLNDDCISWNYEEDGHGNDVDKHLDYVMDFTKHYPYWEQLKLEGYNHVIEIDGIWYWAKRERNF